MSRLVPPEVVMSGADRWMAFLDLLCVLEGQLIGSLVIFEWGNNITKFSMGKKDGGI